MSRYSVHPMEKKFIKDTTGLDLDAQPQLTNDQFQNLHNGRPKDAPRPDKEIEALRKQVAELEKERDVARSAHLRACQDVCDAQARIAELRDAITMHLLYHEKSCVYLSEALSRTDDTASLEAYRNKVIDDLKQDNYLQASGEHIIKRLEELKELKR